MKAEADMEVIVLKENAQARLDVAENKTVALIKECEAEEEQQTNQAPERKFQQKMKLNGSLQHLAKTGHMVVSG